MPVILEALADERPHTSQEVAAYVANKLNVTEEEQTEILPSGTQTRFKNRIGWSRTELKFAGLVVSPGRGQIQITQRGLDVLKKNLTRFDAKFLRQFPEYTKALGGEKEENQVAFEASAQTLLDPRETIERSIDAHRLRLAAELLEKIKQRPPEFFEKLVLDLMQKLGYGSLIPDAAEHRGRSNDRGIDGVIREDRLGLDVIYVQAKRWDSPVGSSVVREFLGSLDHAGAKKGVLITTSTFTKEARLPSTRSDKKIAFIDGLDLANLMIDHDLGVSPGKPFFIKQIDSDFFEED